MTRGRHTNTAHVIVETDNDHTPPPRRQPADVLAAAVARSGVEPAATHVMRVQQARSEDLALLYPLWHQARTYIDQHAGPDHTSRLVELHRRAGPLADLNIAVADLHARLA